MPSQDLIFPILPRPAPKVEREKSKVRQVSERPVIATSEQEQHQPAQDELDRIAKALEQRDRQRKRHPQANNKKLKKLQQMQQGFEENDDEGKNSPPHLDITA
ncbi:hypothetical protein K0504_10555 [Neiella marina]|uniref:Uncharacterized protein n=1 Tax=Neiella holothuriorum TaxID=2870530 RepID=A0ABS7EGK6_9GAMM|nr:hypothetical protein [Neiella holothuriorum]MBW8191477.1 hypothetical protein [Neiella holothuriorum]